MYDHLPSDPAMLLGFVNMKLRDEFDSFDELCQSLGVDRADIEARLAAIDYHYVPAQNQFK